jgi:hypothetical protein
MFTPIPAATRRHNVGNCGEYCTMLGMKPALAAVYRTVISQRPHVACEEHEGLGAKISDAE